MGTVSKTLLATGNYTQYTYDHDRPDHQSSAHQQIHNEFNALEMVGTVLLGGKAGEGSSAGGVADQAASKCGCE